MIPLETTTETWKWQLNAIPVVNISEANPNSATSRDQNN